MQRPMLTQLPGTTRQEKARHQPAFGRRAARMDKQPAPSHAEPEAVEITPTRPFVSSTDRFQPGMLKQVQDKDTARAEKEARSKGWRLFDKTLLAAEVISAIVVTWLVAQYVYTAYIDTTPHRLGSNSALPAGSLVGKVTRTATLTPGVAMSTPTLVSEVAPPVQGPAQAPNSYAGGTSAPGFDVQPEEAPTELLDTPTQTPTSTPTVDPQALLPSRLRIPVMFLDSPVHEVHVNMGTWEVSPMDIGHHEGSANPGDTGNVVLAGHRDINSALFRDLDRLKPGDSVFVSNSLREYRYVVTDSFVVTPDHTEVMDPTDDKRVTLITCTPIGLATQRLIVIAILDETYTGGQTQGDR